MYMGVINCSKHFVIFPGGKKNRCFGDVDRILYTPELKKPFWVIRVFIHDRPCSIFGRVTMRAVTRVISALSLYCSRLHQIKIPLFLR
jgi:hypothetical protein